MGYSYQDIEARLQVIERKVEFILGTFTVTKTERTLLGPTIQTTMTLAEVYREVQAAGAALVNLTDQPEASPNGTAPDAA